MRTPNGSTLVRCRRVVATVAVLTASVTATAGTGRAVAAAPTASTAPIVVSDGRSVYRVVTPCRLIDTRPGNPADQSAAVVDPSTLHIAVAGRCGVPTDASAIAVSIAVTATTADGYAAVTPAGSLGRTSTVNWIAGETRSASTVVATAANGALEVHVSAGLAAAAIVVDVTGAWTPVASVAGGGRLVTIDTRRVLDTRLRTSRVAAGDTVTIDRSTLAVPVDALAVSGTLTATGGAHAGYLTAFPVGTAVPLASNVNTDAAQQDRAAGVIVALGAAGLSVYAGAATTDIIFDVTGYVTGPSAPASTAGLLVPLAPVRVLDTRATAHPAVTSTIADVAGAMHAAELGGVIATITATDAASAGFASVTAIGGTRAPDRAADATSVLNWSGGRGAVAAMMVQPLAAGGQLAVSASSATALIVDATAYLLGIGASAGGPQGSGGLMVDVPAATASSSTATTAVAATATRPRPLATGVIDDRTGTGKATGDPAALLRQTYTAAELAAGGGVSIVFSDVPGGSPAMVPYDARAFPACGPQPLCMLISPTYWANPGRDPVNSNRVMASHEWGHELSFRYQQYLQGDELAHWIDQETAVDEECLADTVASIVLARGGFPGNETTDYVVHYMCNEYWAQRYGADHVAQMRAQADALARGLLQWAGAWGAAHPGA